MRGLALAQRGADRGVVLVDRRHQRAAAVVDYPIGLPLEVERRVRQAAAADREPLGLRAQLDRAGHHRQRQRVGHRRPGRGPRRHHDRQRRAAVALGREEVAEARIARVAGVDVAVERAVPRRRHVGAGALHLHHDHLAIELLLEHALDAAGGVGRGQRVVGVAERAVHAEDRHDRDRIAVGGVDADQVQPVVLAVAARQLVVLAAPLAGDGVGRVEVGIGGDAQLGRAQIGDRRARRGLAAGQPAVADELAPLAGADLERRVRGVLRPRGVAVRRRQQDLAAVLGAQPLLEIEDEALVGEDRVDLDPHDGLAAGAQRQRLGHRPGVDADRREEPAGQRHLAVVDLVGHAEERAARGVAAQRGADRHVERRLAGPGHQRRGGGRGAGGGVGRHRLVAAVRGGDGRPGVDRRRGAAVVAARGDGDEDERCERARARATEAPGLPT
jgi:hypothetical protein